MTSQLTLRRPMLRHFAMMLMMGLPWVPDSLVAVDARLLSADAQVQVPAAPPAHAGPAPRRVEAWIVLAMPGTISMRARSAAEQRDYRTEIETQQSSLLRELTALGAVERGRQTLTRSAVLVEVDDALLGRIAKFPGVSRVQKVTHGHSTDGQPAHPARAPGSSPAARR